MLNFLDVEASGLGVGSYPIEVGVALNDGSTQCTLICPANDWTHWDNAAEQLHGISRDELLINGRSPLNVAMMLNEWLGDSMVYSDAWGNDVCWLSRLFDEAGVKQRFKLDSVVSVLTSEELDYWAFVKEHIERQLFIRRHRASNDALILHRTYAMLKDEVAMASLLSHDQTKQRYANQLDADLLMPEPTNFNKTLVADIEANADLKANVRGNDADDNRATLADMLAIDKLIKQSEQEQLLCLLEKKQLQY